MLYRCRKIPRAEQRIILCRLCLSLESNLHTIGKTFVFAISTFNPKMFGVSSGFSIFVTYATQLRNKRAFDWRAYQRLRIFQTRRNGLANISLAEKIFRFVASRFIVPDVIRTYLYLSYVRQPVDAFDPSKKGGMKYQSPRFSLFKAKNRVRRTGETQFFMSDYVEEREEENRGRAGEERENEKKEREGERQGKGRKRRGY